MKPAQTIVVVGGNAAGAAAAAKAKRVNPNAKVMLLEQSKYISTGTCELPYVLSGEIDDPHKIVFYDEQRFFDEKQVQVYTRQKVVEINPRGKFITVHSLADNNLNQLNYDKLILSTGSKVKPIPQLTFELINVFTLKTVEDVIRIKEYIPNSKLKRVCVVGSGYIGLETTESLSKLDYEVILIEQANEPLPSADKEIRKRIKKILEEENVNYFGDARNIKYKTELSKVSEVFFNGRTYQIDFIINCTGFTPNNLLARQAKLEIGKFGGINVNNKLQTSEKDIYACGDCIEVKNLITRSDDYIPLATFAQRQGHIAGENAALGNVFYQPVVKNISVKIFDNYFAQVGLGEQELQKRSVLFSSIEETVPNLVKVMKGSLPVYGKILFDRSSKKIFGASFLGGKEVSGYADIISTYIKNNIPVQQLANTEYNYTPPLSPFISLLSVLGRKSLNIS